MSTVINALLAATLGNFKTWAEKKLATDQLKAETLARNAREGIPGWSDEFIVVCLYAPLILCFFGPTQDYVRIGFITIEEYVPEAYLWLVATVTGGVFGFDKLLKFGFRRK